MSDEEMRLAAVVPPPARERAVRNVVRHPDGRREILPPAAVLVLHADPARPEGGASVVAYSAEGAVVRESWYLTPDEARGCVAREYEGQLGEWRPLAPGAPPLDALAGGAPVVPEVPPG